MFTTIINIYKIINWYKALRAQGLHYSKPKKACLIISRLYKKV